MRCTSIDLIHSGIHNFNRIELNSRSVCSVVLERKRFFFHCGNERENPQSYTICIVGNVSNASERRRKAISVRKHVHTHTNRGARALSANLSVRRSAIAASFFFALVKRETNGQSETERKSRRRSPCVVCRQQRRRRRRQRLT